MRIFIVLFITSFFVGCKDDKWRAQTCSPVTLSCGKMDYGPYGSLDECINKMKNVGWGFNCAQGCKSEVESSICDKVMRYAVEFKYGIYTVIPNQSNP